MLLTFHLILLLFALGSTKHTYSGIQIANGSDIYQIREKPNEVLEIIEPKPKIPTLREIIYFKIKETPVINPLEKEKLLQEQDPDSDNNDSNDRPFTNGPGFQFLDLDPIDLYKSDENDNYDSGDSYNDNSDNDSGSSETSPESHESKNNSSSKQINIHESNPSSHENKNNSNYNNSGINQNKNGSHESKNGSKESKIDSHENKNNSRENKNDSHETKIDIYKIKTDINIENKADNDKLKSGFSDGRSDESENINKNNDVSQQTRPPIAINNSEVDNSKKLVRRKRDIRYIHLPFINPENYINYPSNPYSTDIRYRPYSEDSSESDDDSLDSDNDRGYNAEPEEEDEDESRDDTPIAPPNWPTVIAPCNLNNFKSITKENELDNFPERSIHNQSQKPTKYNHLNESDKKSLKKEQKKTPCPATNNFCQCNTEPTNADKCATQTKESTDEQLHKDKDTSPVVPECSIQNQSQKPTKYNNLNETNKESLNKNKDISDDKKDNEPIENALDKLLKKDEFWKWLTAAYYIQVLNEQLDEIAKKEIAKQINKTLNHENEKESVNNTNGNNSNVTTENSIPKTNNTNKSIAPMKEPSNVMNETVSNGHESNDTSPANPLANNTNATTEKSIPENNNTTKNIAPKKDRSNVMNTTLSNGHKSNKTTPAIPNTSSIYGNAVDSDHVTNIFIFYPNAQNNTTAKDIEAILGNKNNNVVVLGSPSNDNKESAPANTTAPAAPTAPADNAANKTAPADTAATPAGPADKAAKPAKPDDTAAKSTDNTAAKPTDNTAAKPAALTDTATKPAAPTDNAAKPAATKT